MFEQNVQTALLFVSIPIIAMICLALNLFIRARGDRSVSMFLKAFGVEVRVESSTVCKHTKDGQDEAHSTEGQ